MTIKLIEGMPIEIISNTIENLSNATIHIITQRNISNEDVFTIFLNDFKLENKSGTIFEVEPRFIKKKNNMLGVIWKKPSGETLTFQREIDIELYFSVGGVPVERLPQVIIDIQNKIHALEKEIKKIKEEGTVI